MIEVKTKIISQVKQKIDGKMYDRYWTAIPKAFADKVVRDDKDRVVVHTILIDGVLLFAMDRDTLDRIMENFNKIFNNGE